MNYKSCVYFVEGPCEKQLIDALKAEPRLLTPGKVNVHNVIQDIIPRRVVNTIKAGTTVVFAFDTDIDKTDVLLKNIAYMKKYAAQIKIILLAQVMNFEDEIERTTDVKKAQELTKSTSISHFKSDFCRLKVAECRNTLERHHLDVSVLWTKNPPENFSFVKQNGDTIKL